MPVAPQFDCGSGNGGPGVDPWQTSVDNRLASLDGRLDRFRSEAKGNFRTTWWTIGAGVLAVLGAFAGGVLYVGDRIDSAVLALIARLPVQ